MGAIHLRMVELKRDGKVIAESFLAVFSPDHKGIVENAAVHANGTVNFCINNGRCANYHTVARQALAWPVSATWAV